MRRSEREVTQEEALRYFDQSPYMSVSCVDEQGKPYTIPLSGVRCGNHIYFHSATEGKKAALFQNGMDVFVSAVCYAESSKTRFTMYYQSVMIEGSIDLVTDPDEKYNALYRLCERYTPTKMAAFEGAMKSAEMTYVYRIAIHQISGKQHRSS